MTSAFAYFLFSTHHRCIDYYLKGQLGLTRDGSNVVVVLTHALNITHHKRQFEEKSKNKMSAVQVSANRNFFS